MLRPKIGSFEKPVGFRIQKLIGVAQNLSRADGSNLLRHMRQRLGSIALMVPFDKR